MHDQALQGTEATLVTTIRRAVRNKKVLHSLQEMSGLHRIKSRFCAFTYTFPELLTFTQANLHALSRA